MNGKKPVPDVEVSADQGDEVSLLAGPILRTTRKTTKQFKKIPVRGQFMFASGSPAGTWVKTGTRTYAAPTPEKHTFNGKVLPATVTGRVKYWQGATFTANLAVSVVEVYPSFVMTEADKINW